MTTSSLETQTKHKTTGKISTKRKINSKIGVIRLLFDDASHTEDDQFLIKNYSLLKSVHVGEHVEITYVNQENDGTNVNFVQKRAISITPLHTQGTEEEEEEQKKPTLQSLQKRHGYTYITFPSLKQPVYLPGEEVWILKNKKLFSKAKILHEMISDPTSKFYGRYPVCYLNDGSNYHVNPKSVCRIESENKRVIVCESTLVYRKLAATQTCSNDVVLEIGSALGQATCHLAQHCGKVVGVDKSQEFVDISRRNHPHLEFICMDVIEQKDSLIQLATTLYVNKIFVDINGNRMLKTVLLVLDLVEKYLVPCLIVVKSRELYARLYSEDLCFH